MVAAVSSAGLRFFRHYRRPDSCALTGETAEHLRLKRELLAAVRAVAGWRAEAEVPGEGWRADVLATGPDGRRIAFEVQVSRIDDEAQERTRRLAASGVEVCWLMVRRSSIAAAPGLAGLPRAAVMLSDDTETQVTTFAEAFDLAEPFAPERAGWRAVTVGLPAFVAGVCRGSVRWVGGVRPLATGGAWTTRQHLAAAREHSAWWDGIIRRWGSGRPALIRERPVFAQPPPTDDARVRELIAWQKRMRRGWGRWGPSRP